MKVSVVIMTQNNADLIGRCLDSVAGWAKEIVIVDAGSRDRTVAIVKKYGAKVFFEPWQGFAKQRNKASTKATGNWLFYLDPDERLTSELRKEIDRLPEESPSAAFEVKRENYIMGKLLKKGGWYPDWQRRLINKNKLKRWVGRIHEYAQVEGEVKKLNGAIIHLTHRGIDWNMSKSIAYTEPVADLIFKSGHVRVRWWHLFTAPARQFWYRGIVKGGLLEGMEGLIAVLYQAFDTFITYAKLWEKQQPESMPQKYKKLDGR